MRRRRPTMYSLISEGDCWYEGHLQHTLAVFSNIYGRPITAQDIETSPKTGLPGVLRVKRSVAPPPRRLINWSARFIEEARRHA